MLKTPRLRLMIMLALWATAVSCAHRQPIYILDAPPQGAFNTMGMLSAQGENEASAVERLVDQAEGLGAEALIIVGRKQLGRTLILTARAIRYRNPTPAQ